MMMPGRNYSAQSGYRYGFNGKENDNEVKGEGNEQDYGMRIYDPRVGRFLSRDPLTKKYPELTPYQFASNTPIQGIDQDGLEVYYAQNGSRLGQVGGSTQVRLISDVNPKVATQWINQANHGYGLTQTAASAGLAIRSTDVGMKEDELNMRAMLTVMKHHEGSSPGMEAYYTWNGGERFKKTSDHPGFNSKGSSAAGAYQILKGSWDDEYTGKKYRQKYGITDFSPQSQDKFTVATIKDKITVKAYEPIIEGNFSEAIKRMASEWRFLPGPDTQSHIKPETVLSEIKTAITNEVNNKSEIATPKGQLLTNFRK